MRGVKHLASEEAVTGAATTYQKTLAASDKSSTDEPMAIEENFERATMGLKTLLIKLIASMEGVWWLLYIKRAQ